MPKDFLSELLDAQDTFVFTSAGSLLERVIYYMLFGAFKKKHK